MQRRGGGRGLGAVLFTDIVGSTAIAAEMGNTRWSELVVRHHRIVRRELSRFGGHEMDTAGDGFFATFERPAEAILCAVSIAEAIRELGIEIRAGVSFGELESVGKKASGLVVNTASRVMSIAGPGEVLVPASVREITTGGGISYADHGVHQLKGLDGEFRLFKVAEVAGQARTAPLEPEEAAERRREIFPTGSSRRRALLAGIGAGIVALIVAGVLLWTGGEPAGPSRVAGRHRDSVVSFDVENRRLGTPIALTSVGRRTVPFERYIDHPLATGEGGVWVLRPPFVQHVDPLHDESRPAGLDIGYDTSQSVDTGFGSVWVLSGNTLFKVHPATTEGTPFVMLPVSDNAPGTTFTLGGDAIWVAESDGTLVKLDPFTGAHDQAETGLSIDQIVATDGTVWVSDPLEGSLIEIDPESFQRQGRPLRVGGSIDEFAGLGDVLWVLDEQAGALTRARVSSRNVSQPVRIGDDPSGMAVGRDAVWVGDRGGSLYRVDTETLQVERFDIGSEVLFVAVDRANPDEMVWLYLGGPTE